MVLKIMNKNCKVIDKNDETSRFMMKRSTWGFDRKYIQNNTPTDIYICMYTEGVGTWFSRIETLILIRTVKGKPASQHNVLSVIQVPNRIIHHYIQVNKREGEKGRE